MDHPNCIKLYDVYITPRKVYIVTELVTGGELLDRCGRKWLLHSIILMVQQKCSHDHFVVMPMMGFHRDCSMCTTAWVP